MFVLVFVLLLVALGSVLVICVVMLVFLLEVFVLVAFVGGCVGIDGAGDYVGCCCLSHWAPC